MSTNKSTWNFLLELRRYSETRDINRVREIWSSVEKSLVDTQRRHFVCLLRNEDDQTSPISPTKQSLSLFTYLSEPQQRPPSSKVFRIEFYDYESDFEFKLCGLNLSLSETSLKGSLCVFSLFREKMGSTTLLDVSRAELGLVVMYLNKAEARDKLCRAIQYGSKFLSGGQPGTAQNVDKSTSLARKVFRLFKVYNPFLDFFVFSFDFCNLLCFIFVL